MTIGETLVRPIPATRHIPLVAYTLPTFALRPYAMLVQLVPLPVDLRVCAALAIQGLDPHARCVLLEHTAQVQV